MLRLLTKFKTQSLNEVKPYDSNGSFVPTAGEVIGDDDGVQYQTWQHDGCPNEPAEDMNRAPFLYRMPNVRVKTPQLSLEPRKEDQQMCNENKENGEKLMSVNLVQNKPTALYGEKRKWSDLKRSRFPKQQNFSSDSSSSDEEVKELFSKQPKCDESLPEGVEEKGQYQSSVRASKLRACEGHARKRYRSTSHDKPYRPSLDFEKMRQKVFWKKTSCGISRPRVVKVRSFSGQPHNLLPDPTIVSFKPIQGIQSFKLTPVEETRALAF